MEFSLLIPVIRQLLQIFGGVLITKGYVDSDGLNALIGLILNLLTFGWWYYGTYLKPKTVIHETKKEQIVVETVDKETVDEQVVITTVDK